MKIKCETQEGERVPTFYLPVHRSDYGRYYKCYVFPLAPFVLVGIIINDMFRSLWWDLMEFSRALRYKVTKGEQ